MKAGHIIQRELRRAYRLMINRSGHQGWWPGNTPFEVCVGAILTQNTAWTNVEKAIVTLKLENDPQLKKIKEEWEAKSKAYLQERAQEAVQQ